MKKTSKILLLAICLILILCGCTKKSEEPSSKYDLGGKTYYSHDDRYETKDVSSVWFGKDGSFVLKDNFYDGWYEIIGTWSVSENVVTLDVSSSGVGNFTKIRFEITDENNLILKTTLAGSESEDRFKTKKPEATETELIYTTYYNVSQTEVINKSYLEMHSDGSFALVDRNDFGIFEYNGTYVLIGGNLILNLDKEDEGMSQIFMEQESEDCFVLKTDLGNSVYGDRFCIPGTDPGIPGPEGAPTLENSEWRHEAIPDLPEDYYPSIKFDSAGMFDFTENLYAGFGHFIGWYEKTDKGYLCHVDDASTVQGFAGGDTELIEFELKDNNTMILKTDLCMSMSGDVFEKLPSY